MGLTDLVCVRDLLRGRAGRINVDLHTDDSCPKDIPIERVIAIASSPSLPFSCPGPDGRLIRQVLAFMAKIAELNSVDLRGEWTDSVRIKYEEQSSDYAGEFQKTPVEITSLLASCSGRLTILVGGCGTGPDLVTFWEMGHSPVGVDFSEKMLKKARNRCGTKDIPLTVMDLTAPAFKDRVFSWIYLLPDVYSFIPRRRIRIRSLQRLQSCVREEGELILSARLLIGWETFCLCAIFWLRMRMSGRRAEWGDFYTSYISKDGRLRQAFVHLFTSGRIRRELGDAGWKKIWRLKNLWFCKE